MQHRQVRRRSGPHATRFRAEHPSRPVPQQRLPLSDLVGMNVELLCQLGQRLLALDGSQSHLRLESRCVVPARSFGHRLVRWFCRPEHHIRSVAGERTACASSWHRSLEERLRPRSPYSADQTRRYLGGGGSPLTLRTRVTNRRPCPRLLPNISEYMDTAPTAWRGIDTA